VRQAAEDSICTAATLDKRKQGVLEVSIEFCGQESSARKEVQIGCRTIMCEL